MHRSATRLGPVGEVGQRVGDLSGPIATVVTVVEVTLDRGTQPVGSSTAVDLPAGVELGGTTEGDVGERAYPFCIPVTLQLCGNLFRFAIQWLEVFHGEVLPSFCRSLAELCAGATVSNWSK